MQKRHQPIAPSATSRRDFLKLSGTLAAASALAGVAVPPVHAAEARPIRLALIGCGGRGTGAVADAFAATGGPVEARTPWPTCSTSRLQASLDHLEKAYPDRDKVDVPPERRFLGFDAYKKAIDCLAPGDVAMLTTPAAFRPMHFEYAVGKGVNVFMEKSFAVDAAGRAADARRRPRRRRRRTSRWPSASCGGTPRPGRRSIQRIHDGAIGDVHTLRIYRVHGPVHCPQRPPDANELAFQLQHPVCFNWLTGGFFVDWHCHNVDVACWAKNAWPVSAQGMGGRCYPEAGNLFDHYTVEYTFADGAKLFAFSRHMKRLLAGTYADYAHGTKGSAVIMTNSRRPSRGSTRARTWPTTSSSGSYDARPSRIPTTRVATAVGRDPPEQAAQRGPARGRGRPGGPDGPRAAHTGNCVTWDEAMKSNFQYVNDIDHMTFDTPAPITAGPTASTPPRCRA